jgi:GMP synthase-like glutamine amidotransferase
MQRIHCLQHVPFETLGIIESIAQKYSCPVTDTRVWENTNFPAFDSFDLLIILGGPMNIYEHDIHPWLAEEKSFIKKTIDAGKKVLGVCLGSQLLADALGGTVIRNRCKEIGWYPVTLLKTCSESPIFKNIPPVFTPFHWHGDTYPPPPGAVLVGSSDACENQGFIFDNRVVGLQFHLEMTIDSLLAIIDVCSKELISDEFIHTAREIKYYAEKLLKPAHGIMERIFQNIIELP